MEWYTIVHKDTMELVPPIDDSGMVEGDDPGMVFRTLDGAQSMAAYQNYNYDLDTMAVPLSAAKR